MRPERPEFIAGEPHRGEGDATELLADGALSVAAAAEFASLSRASLYEAMQRGELLYLKRGRRRLIPKRALVLWLAEGFKDS